MAPTAVGSPNPAAAGRFVFWSEQDEDSTQPIAGPSFSKSDTDGFEQGMKEGPYGRSMYLECFEETLATVLANESHLFTREELEVFQRYKRLPELAKYLFVRVFLRKEDKLHRLSDLKYEAELGINGIRSAIELLCKPCDSGGPRTDYIKPKIEELPANPVPGDRPTRSWSIVRELAPTRIQNPEPAPEIVDSTIGDGEVKLEEPAEPNLAQMEPQGGCVSEPSSSLGPPSQSLRSPDLLSFAFDDTMVEARELLACLRVDELKALAKSIKIRKPNQKRDDLIEAIIACSNKQYTLAFQTPSKADGTQTQQMTLSQALAGVNKSPTAHGEQLRKVIMQTLVKCIRLNRDIVDLFRRVQLVYFRSTAYDPDLLRHSILARAKKRRYADYKFERTANIWPDRDALLKYEQALILEAEVDELLGTYSGTTPSARNDIRSSMSVSGTPAPSNASRLTTPATPGMRSSMCESPATPRCAKRIAGAAGAPTGMLWEQASIAEEVEDSTEDARTGPRTAAESRVLEKLEALYPQWLALLEDREAAEPACEADLLPERRPGLERFDCGHVLTRVLCKCTEPLGRLKEYEKELGILESLLSQRRWRRGRRGRWHERRSIILNTHLKDHHRAMDAVIEGLADDDTHFVWRPKLVNRLTTLEKKLKIPEAQRHICHGSLKKSSERVFEGERIGRLELDSQLRIKPTQTNWLSQAGEERKAKEAANNTNPGKGKANTGRTLWIGRDGVSVSVEAFALERYADELGFKGIHSEGRIVTTLFGILFWDVIFVPLPGAFETPYQTAPLDFAGETFYFSRKTLADARLDEVKSGKGPEMISRMFDEHRDTVCVGVRWDLVEKDDLVAIAKCLGPDVLAAICRLLLENYASRVGGVPDLILWNEETSKALFAEVKSDNDKLSANQNVWIDALLHAGMPVEVCLVRAKGSLGGTVAKVKKEAKTKGNTKGGGRQQRTATPRATNKRKAPPSPDVESDTEESHWSRMTMDETVLPQFGDQVQQGRVGGPPSRMTRSGQMTATGCSPIKRQKME